jgi:hypothetical protein
MNPRLAHSLMALPFAIRNEPVPWMKMTAG